MIEEFIKSHLDWIEFFRENATCHYSPWEDPFHVEEILPVQVFDLGMNKTERQENVLRSFSSEC